MPLSDREQQILADIEARLQAEDPRFAKAVGTRTVSTHARRQIKLALAAFGVGFVLLFVGVVVGLPWGIAGFVLMLGGAVHGGNMVKRLGADATPNLGGQLRGGLQRYLDARRHEDGRGT